MKGKHIHLKVGKKSKQIIARDENVMSPLTRESEFVFAKGKGSQVWDADGKKYVDFAAGVAVMNIGYGNKDVEKAIIAQAKQGTHAGFADYFSEQPVTLAETLVAMLPAGLNRVFLSNSGTEAVEAAYKCARWHTNKKWFVAFDPCFHGRTMGSLSMTNSMPVHRKRFAPFLPVRHTPYPYLYRSRFDSENDLAHDCLQKVEATLKKNKNETAGIMFEPVSGEGGYIVPPKLFVKGLRKLCTQKSVLLCADEVQSGCFRTGTFLAIENFGVKPDIVSMSKSIGGGIPLGATIANKKIMDWVPGAHANTFGGNLIASAAGKATLDFMKRHSLGNKAQKTGKLMMRRLQEMLEDSTIIGDVRGLGLMIGVEIVSNKKTKKHGVSERTAIIKHGLENGLVLLPAGKSTIRICPPLIIDKREAMDGLEKLATAIRNTEGKL
jgi:4-aminobutyrate aminotransferase